MTATHRWSRPVRTLIPGLLLATTLAACGSSTPAATPTPAPAASGPAPAASVPAPAASEPAGPAASLGITVDGAVVTIVGMGRGDSDPFELPAGSATMTITACQSNGVMPIITLVDGSGGNAGIIVDPEKVLSNLAGGTYHIAAQANPGCLWQVRLTPG